MAFRVLALASSPDLGLRARLVTDPRGQCFVFSFLVNVSSKVSFLARIFNVKFLREEAFSNGNHP